MRDFTGIAPSTLPAPDAPDFQPRLRNMLSLIDYWARDASRGFARINAGQVPSGSGAAIPGTFDTAVLLDYFYLPGRVGGQVGIGAPGDSGTLTLKGGSVATGSKVAFAFANTSISDQTGRLVLNSSDVGARINLVMSTGGVEVGIDMTQGAGGAGGDFIKCLSAARAATVFQVRTDGSLDHALIRNTLDTTVPLKIITNATQSVDMVQVRDSTDTVSWLAISSAGRVTLGDTAFNVGTVGGFTAIFDVGAITANRTYVVPDGGGTLVVSGVLALLLANISSNFRTDTNVSGAAFADNTDTSKRLRFITSGCLTNTQNALAFTSTAARTWLMPDHAGIILNEVAVIDLIGQTASIGSTTLFTPPSYSAPFTVASCGTTNASVAVTSSAGFGSVTSGMHVTGTGIPDNTYVVNKISSSSIRLSRTATATGTVTLTFAAVGKYQVSVYMTCTTAGGAGAQVILTLSHNDGTAAQTFPVATLVLTTANNKANGVYNFVANASAVSYSTTLVTGGGAPAHTLYLTVTAL